jgi:hypothetical protein
MRKIVPIYLPREEYTFIVHGKPWVQKNNLVIRFKNPRFRKGPYIGHAEDMKVAREEIAHSLYSQYLQQGGMDPLICHLEIDFVFYVDSAHEPDLDNLPAIICDALQGVRDDMNENPKAKLAVVVSNDKLFRYGTMLKIVKGDIGYAGEPRTEIGIRRYYGSNM